MKNLERKVTLYCPICGNDQFSCIDESIDNLGNTTTPKNNSSNATISLSCELVEKLEWFKKHLPSVCFDEIHIIEYGTPKSSCSNSLEDILFDDEDKNRKEWHGKAYDEKNLIKTLRSFLCPT